MDNSGWRTWAEGASSGLGAGIAVLPYALFRYYRRLKLQDDELLLLIHLMNFKQVEHKEFPMLEDMMEITGGTTTEISLTLQKLMKDGFLSIDEEFDEESGILYERYNVSGLYDKLSICMANDAKNKAKQAVAQRETALINTSEPEGELNMFSIFEKEFGRPLSPMECEAISGWLDQDKYADELILMALKEAVFAGKIHFRYIDRILLEWSRNRVKNVNDAKAYTQKFRNTGRS
ncbi:DnaD domain-containing protein [Paenibacillus crassostreae]|uniref:DNA replication protein DnaD n=1 Tax=Paenibacillus crassostreae TaxID=1763538 RepID=A0A167DLT7_9BACL|nr:DnaD domain-containing protein [Paenibacillus crassostreae]AOZ91302.1 DNA replication protein DnaD [Paenibacillus crassostreae]OAB74540.1 DNA replication protein DnaD [Paenibacillus crassostreae]